MIEEEILLYPSYTKLKAGRCVPSDFGICVTIRDAAQLSMQQQLMSLRGGCKKRSWFSCRPKISIRRVRKNPSTKVRPATTATPDMICEYISTISDRFAWWMQDEALYHWTKRHIAKRTMICILSLILLYQPFPITTSRITKHTHRSRNITSPRVIPLQGSAVRQRTRFREPEHL